MRLRPDVAQGGEVAVRGLGVEPLAPVPEAQVLGHGQAEEQAAALGHVGDAEAGARRWAIARRGRSRTGGSGRSSGATSPEIARSVVVLPAPLAPSKRDDLPCADVEIESSRTTAASS